MHVERLFRATISDNTDITEYAEKPQVSRREQINPKLTMKKQLFLSMAVVIAACMSSCGPKKQVAQPASARGDVEIEVPCKETGFDDADYFRGTGTSTSINKQSARTAALENAKGVIRRKLGGFVQGLSADYSTAVAGQAQADKVQRLMETEMNEVVERMLNDAEQICEKMFITGNTGQYESWISLQIPKKVMIDKMEQALTSDEELEIYFKRDEFRKYAEDKIQKMKEARKEATGR